jgi:hypothetical protein
MLEEHEAQQLYQAFKRIFSLNISKSTFKEVQRTIYTATKENREKTEQIVEVLLNGPNYSVERIDSNFKKIIEEFGAPVRLARDVIERGDFISFLSSDLIAPSDRPLFINFIRRVDGEELQFLTEPEGVIHLIKHFIARLEELKRFDPDKKFAPEQTRDLQKLKERLENVLLT